ncbi:MAG TPA: rhodanese-like domain-containing protein [Thermoanaerobaculia bacterium]
MKLRNPWIQAVALVAIAFVFALVSNAFAGRTRKLVLPGYYPNALRVPKQARTTAATAATATPPAAVSPAATATAPTATLPPATATVAQSPGPGQPPIVIPTDTIARPAGTSTAVPPTTTAHAPAPAPAAAVNIEERFPPHPDKAYVEISGEDVALLHSKGVLFLDARRTSVFEQGHIAGARSFSVWESDIDEKVNKLFEERSDPREQNRPIVIYCSGGDCEDSHMLAQKLWGFQFNNVYVYKDGFPDWQKRNGAVRTGAAQ